MTSASPASRQCVKPVTLAVKAVPLLADRPARKKIWRSPRTPLAIFMTAAVLGCGDTVVTPENSVPTWSRLSPRTANFSGSANEEVTVVGQTYGPNGEFYTLQNAQLTHQNFYYLNSLGDPVVHDTVVVYEYELQSSLLPSSTTPYNGGDISILITHGGATVATGGVHANMDMAQGIFAVPAGATVTLEAYPNAGCRFEGWTVNGSTYQSTASVFVDYGGGGSRNYTGVFHCHRGY